LQLQADTPLLADEVKALECDLSAGWFFDFSHLLIC
jgi:hypothetical protein